MAELIADSYRFDAFNAASRRVYFCATTVESSCRAPVLVGHANVGTKVMRTYAEKVTALGSAATLGPDEGKTAVDIFHRTNPQLAPLLLEQGWSRLMAEVQGGDRAAYKRLLCEIMPFIRAIAIRRHATEDVIDDVVQEVLLSVHRVRHTYDPTRPFERWLAAIAERRSIDLLRRRMRRAAVEIADPKAYDTFPDPRANREGETVTRDALGRAMVDLPVRQREAIELLKLRELSLREAAHVSGRSISALKVNMHRALKTLRASFGR